MHEVSASGVLGDEGHDSTRVERGDVGGNEHVKSEIETAADAMVIDGVASDGARDEKTREESTRDEGRSDESIRERRDSPSDTREEARKKSKLEISATQHGSALSSRRPTEQLDVENASLSSESSDFPEGGREAWLVVVGSTLALYGSFGFMVSIGTLQDYWAENQLKNYSARDIGWIPSVFVYLALSLGIGIGPLFDRYGPTYIALFGSIGYVIMIFLLAECKLYWQFLLCCGILGGATGATLTTTSLAVVAHWFKTRRGLAQGIAMAGSSFGGLTIPLILRNTLPRYGYPWSMRILGFLFLATLIPANILMKARLPPSSDAKKISIISLSIFGDLRFSFLTMAVFGFEIVLFGSLGILPTYTAMATHYPKDTGFYLISCMNGVSCLGRLIPGYISDKIGK